MFRVLAVPSEKYGTQPALVMSVFRRMTQRLISDPIIIQFQFILSFLTCGARLYTGGQGP